jgi:hypothetical protein
MGYSDFTRVCIQSRRDAQCTKGIGKTVRTSFVC